MKFYTTIVRRGNNLLYRGYKDGRRIKKKIPFKPTLFVPAKSKSDYTALDGTAVSPIQYESMKDAREFIETYKDVQNFKIYGNSNYIAQFVAEEFPDEIQFDRSKIRVHTIDIEVHSEDGFPEPSQALHPITSIAIKDSILETYYVWSLCDYDASKSLMQECPVQHVKCETEEFLLSQFVEFWHAEHLCPDIITGWNSRTFDIPYIVNRINRLSGPEAVKMLSPWGSVEEKTITMKKGQVQIYDIAGIAQVDYMDLFQKFGYSFGPQESYKLDHIANVVLGEKKLSYEEEGSLGRLYKENPQKYIDYNIRDVYLVDKMEDKIALITLCVTMAYKAGVNYTDTFGTTGIWDSLIHRYLMKDKIIVPPSKESFKSDYEGGYVKEPQCGVHDWVCSFDVNSLYPNIIVQWNMSPETIVDDVEPNVTVDKILNGFTSSSNMSMAATGQYFSTKKQGFMPKIIEEMYDERVVIKKKMLKSKQELELCDKANLTEVYRIERDIAHFENQQTAIKILLNSLYGALGNKYFRYFTMQIAEGITITGQCIIKHAEKHVNTYLNKLLKTNVDRVIAIDTDSIYVNMSDLVNAAAPNVTLNKKIDFLDKACAKIEKEVLEKNFLELGQSLNVFKPRITMKRESIADRAIWTAKKRYILNVWDQEGVRYSTPKLKMMGIEAIKSSTPASCRDAFKKLFKVMIAGSEEESQKFVADYKATFLALPPEEKAFPRGVSSLKQYADKKTIYKKATPINSRAALLYNYMLEDKFVTNKYEAVKDGEKIKYIYLKKPNPLGEDVIAFTSILPPEFELHRYIDNEKQFQKAFQDPAELIFESIGWTIEPSASLEDFFA